MMTSTILFEILAPIFVIVLTIFSKKTLRGDYWQKDDFDFGYELTLITVFIVLLRLNDYLKDFIGLFKNFEISTQYYLNFINNPFLNKVSYVLFIMAVWFVQVNIAFDKQEPYHYLSKATKIIVGNSVAVILYLLFVAIV